MTFGAPLFLLAALAAAIPLVLHMIQRRQAKRLPFATLRFLKSSAQKTRRRKRVHDVLLMVLRAAVLLLIACGLARPTWRMFQSLGGVSHTSAVIILDNSASMGVIDEDRPRLDTAVAAASQILDQLVEGDQVAVVPTCGPAFPEAAVLSRTQDAARQVLHQCAVSYERADLTVAVRNARELLKKSDAPNKHIFILSDMQQVCWDDATPLAANADEKSDESRGGKKLPEDSLRPMEEETGIEMDSSDSPTVVLVDCDCAPKANAAIQHVQFDAAALRVGAPIKIMATIASTSLATQQRRVELLIDGAVEASGNDFTLPAVGRASQELTARFKSPGLHRGEVRLVGEDGSKYDDRRFFSVQIDPVVPIAVVKNSRQGLPYLDDAYYLEQALAAGGVADDSVVTALSPEQLATTPLDRFRVVFCVNVPALDNDAAERLAAYVAQGGNLVWALGDRVVPDAYNHMNRATGERLLPLPLATVEKAGQQENRDSWHIGFLEKDHRALAGLLEPAALYESVLVYQRVRLDASKGSAMVLARCDDGQPLIVEKRVGEGRVVMLATSLQTAETNLPLRPIFLPLITQLTRYLADAGNVRPAITAGQPIVVDYPREKETLEIEVIPPSGEVFRLKTTPRTSGAGQVLQYTDTQQIGVYTLQRLDAPTSRQAICVNFDASEADPSKLTRQELEKRLLPSRVIFAENPRDLTPTFAAMREGRSLWTPFLIAVLAALMVETYISNRFTLRQGQPPLQEPSVRSAASA